MCGSGERRHCSTVVALYSFSWIADSYCAHLHLEVGQSIASRCHGQLRYNIFIFYDQILRLYQDPITNVLKIFLKEIIIC